VQPLPIRQNLRQIVAFAGDTLRRAFVPPPDAAEHDVLPNFCSGWIIFNVVVVAELVAIVINLFLPSGFVTPHAWSDLLVVSVFVQWVALAGTTALCGLRRWLNRLPPLRALLFAYLVLLVSTLVVGELAMLALWAMGKISSLSPAWRGSFQVFNLTISAIANGLLLRYFFAKQELLSRTRSEARAKLQALQSRIRPHFVFNSLNIIASLTRNEPAKAEAAIEDMADLFRIMLTEDESMVPVRNEIEVAKKYLALEGLRLEQRLTVNWDIGSYPRKAVMPVLILQPILEYLIRHGVEDQPAGGALDIRLWDQDDNLHIRIAAPAARSRSRREDAQRDQTIGNIRLRLQNHYGEAARIEQQEQDGTTVITAVLPTRGGNP
jgi:two-component system sensor histidine kinase AlgZ